MGRKKQGITCETCSFVHPTPAEVQAMLATARAGKEKLPSARRKTQNAQAQNEDSAETQSPEVVVQADRVRLRALVAYDGRKFHGMQRTLFSSVWQLKTVQGIIEEAIAHELGILPPDCTVVGSQFSNGVTVEDDKYAIGPRYGHNLPQFSFSMTSRTDSGVSALQQVICFWLLPEHADRLQEQDEGLRQRLEPQGVILTNLEIVSEDEHWSAQKSCRGKLYRYSFYDGSDAPPELPVLHAFNDIFSPALRSRRKDLVYPLDVELMDKAAQAMAGGVYRNFRLFTRSSRRTGRLTTHRILHRIKVLRTKSMCLEIDFDTPSEPKGDFVHLLVEGERFLYLMVRCMAQGLMQVGLGKVSLEHLTIDMLNPPEDASETELGKIIMHAAPGEGLTLVRTYYLNSLFSNEVQAWTYKRVPRPANDYKGPLDSLQASLEEEFDNDDDFDE